MLRWFAPVFGVAMMLGALGCQKDTMSRTDDGAVMASTDVCPSCRGTQKATADGKCDGCGAMLTDACSHCPGVQVSTAEGKCSACGMKMHGN